MSQTVSTCPRCGAENPEHARFCLACAAPLVEDREPVREERKVISVLFVDLVDFTATSESADPEDVRARLRAYHADARAQIERHGGTVEKFVGDAVMAVFGAPIAREDDAERAVRAGLAVLESINLEARGAVNTGEAVVTLSARPETGEGIVAGDVVNTAARLQSAAPSGTVVVGEATYQATQARIDYEPLAPVQAKGKAEPIAVWRASGPRSRLGVDLDEVRRTPLVGREDDLALLRSAYRKAVAESSVQLVTIVGEPGVGKSRIVGELRQFVDGRTELVSWRQGRCLPYGDGVTFWALGEIVKAQAGILESDSTDEAAGKLDEALAVVAASDREWMRRRLAPLIGLAGDGDTAASNDETFAAWKGFFEAIAATRPTVLVFEDIHWADPALLAFLDHLVEWATGVPLLVLCTARPELYDRQQGWGGGKRNSTTVSLAPLTDEQTARLVSALLDRSVLPASTQAVLLERAGGNPLFAEEFVRMLTDRGLLSEHADLDATELSVPDSLQALIAARLDTLPPGRKALVQDAAVVGKVFWPSALVAMDGRDEQEVREGIHELTRREFVRPARVSSVEGESEFAFWHALVRDAAYGQIPRAERLRKHIAAAEWIERLAGERVADLAELLVHHYETARNLAEAVGDHEQQDRVAAPLRRFLRVAGDRALSLDITRAETLYRRALELAPDEHERARMLVGLAEAERELGRLESARQEFEEAIAAFRALGDLGSAGAAMRRLSRVHWFAGDSEEGTRVCTEAVGLLEQEPPGHELARAYAELSSHHGLAGRTEECFRWSAKALPLAERLPDHWAIIRTLTMRGFHRWIVGDVDDGLADLDRSLDLAREHSVEPAAYTNAADIHWIVQGAARGAETLQAGIDVCERRGLTTVEYWTKAELCWVLYDLGHWDRLLQVADDVAVWSRSHGVAPMEAIVRTYQALVLANRGRSSDAGALMADVLPSARRDAENPQVLPQALLVSAVVEEMSGNRETARQLLEDLDRVSEGKAWPRQLVAPEASRRAVAVGSPELAERLLEDMGPQVGRTTNAVMTADAILLEHRGDRADAAERFRQAADAWAEFGHPFEQAQALLGLGRCLMATGRGGATARLSESRRLLVDLGAAPFAAEADELLGQATALSS